MEVETVSQQHINNSLKTSSAHATNVVNSTKQAAIKLENNSLDNGCNGATPNNISNNTQILTLKKSDTSRSNSPASTSSENDKEIQQHTNQSAEHIENQIKHQQQQQFLSTSLTCDIGVTGDDGVNLSTVDVNNSKSNGSLSGASTNSTTGANNVQNNTGYASLNNSMNGATTQQIKKRISSSRTPTRKAKRIKFYRNGDRFYPGITIPVSNERYRSFESLFEDLTRLLEENVKIPGAVRTIYSMDGKKISTLEELEDGLSYVCSCNNENFKKIEYNTTSQPLANITLSNKPANRLVKLNNRPSSPLKNGNASNGNGLNGVNGSPLSLRVNSLDSVVRPRIVTLIRNGTKPRKIMRLLLNKRNSPSFDHVMTAITQVVKLDTGCVRKVFTIKGNPVLSLVDFFGNDDIFFAYGTERVNNSEDFKLETEEHKALQAIRKNLRTPGGTCPGPKPKMPVKSKKCYDMHAPIEIGDQLQNNSGIDPNDLPQIIRDRYALGEIIGDGNFAVVLKIKDRQNGQTFALKIIDKSKCKGKEHYIDAEVRVMKKLEHPNIISLIMNIDHMDNMLLVLEYVSGGDLFDAITRVTRFSEDQSRVMIRRLALAMAYLHSMGIVHRDIKPENLLVELDGKGNVIDLKLADFGLACEVTEPLFAVCGTPTYVAPEILMETGYGLKIDVWAAGIILYILLCGFPPFVSPDNQQEPLFDAIISGVYDFPEPYWSDIGDGVRDLIANMLQSDPEVRFTSEDILDHYWTCNEYNDEQQQIENAENYVSSS